ncbi:MAG: hypothetical protein QM753_17250 [Thermomicrobiales bacterium]
MPRAERDASFHDHGQEYPGPHREITVMPNIPPPADPSDSAMPQHPEKRIDDAPLSETISADRETLDSSALACPWSPEPGNDVIGACGHKIGEIVDQQPGHIVVEVGFFNPSDLYIPTSAIIGHRGDDVTLSVSKDEALHRGWERDPLESE